MSSPLTSRITRAVLWIVVLTSLSLMVRYRFVVFSDERDEQISLFAIEVNKKYGFIDRTGRVVFGPQFDMVSIGPDQLNYPLFGNSDCPPDYQPEYLARGANGWTHITSRGEKKHAGVGIMDVKSVEYIGDSLFRLRGTSGNRRVVDMKHRLKLPDGFRSQAGCFRDGLLPVDKDGKWGFVDRRGRPVIAARYDCVWSFSERKAAFCLDGKFGYMDKHGTHVIAPRPYRSAAYFREGMAVVDLIVEGSRSRGLPVCIDKDGNQIFSDLLVRVSYSEGLVAASDRKKPSLWGYIDKSGEFIIPPKYERASPFSNGRAVVAFESDEPVRRSGGDGYIDKTGTLVIETPRANRTSHFRHGLAWIKTNDDLGRIEGYIDTKGDWIWSHRP